MDNTFHLSRKGKYISSDQLTQKLVKEWLAENRVVEDSNHKTKMAREHNLTEQDWNLLNGNIIGILKDTRTRDFQFRFLNGIVYANDKLHKFGFKKSSKCTYCLMTPQTFTHLFVWCPHVKSLRASLATTAFGRTLTEREWLFGTSDPHETILLILLNMYIYYKNYHGKFLSIAQFKARMGSIKEIEKGIADRHANQRRFLSKWQVIDELLER